MYTLVVRLSTTRLTEELLFLMTLRNFITINCVGSNVRVTNVLEMMEQFTLMQIYKIDWHTRMSVSVNCAKYYRWRNAGTDFGKISLKKVKIQKLCTFTEPLYPWVKRAMDEPHLCSRYVSTCINIHSQENLGAVFSRVQCLYCRCHDRASDIHGQDVNLIS